MDIAGTAGTFDSMSAVLDSVGGFGPLLGGGTGATNVRGVFRQGTVATHVGPVTADVAAPVAGVVTAGDGSTGAGDRCESRANASAAAGRGSIQSARFTASPSLLFAQS